MKMRIAANTLVTRHYLEVTETGVTFCETATVGGVRHVTFDQIDAVTKGADSGLALQIGREILKIPVDYSKADHRTIVARLVSELRRTTRARA
jgi:hypothetical protein